MVNQDEQQARGQEQLQDQGQGKAQGLGAELDNDKMLLWLSKELEPICEADPDVLAKYVLALLKHEANNLDLKSHCVAELRDFLRDYTEDFVVSLFEAIESGSYKLPSGGAGDESFVGDEEEDEDSMWGRRRRSHSDEDADRETEDSFKRRRSSTLNPPPLTPHRFDGRETEGKEDQKPEPVGPPPRSAGEEKIESSPSQRFENRRDGRGSGRNGHHDRDRDRRMDSRGGFGRGMPSMMGMGYHESMYGRGPPMRGGGQMFPPQGPPGFGRMDSWMGGMHPHPPPNMYPPMMGMPMNPMMGNPGGGMFDGPQGHWQHQQQRGPPQGHHQMPQRGNGMMGMGNENHFEGPPQHPEEFQGHGHAHGQGYGLGHGQGHGHGHGRQQSFEESATLKCTGIPRYVKEAELYSHFAKFGKIVKMDLKRFGADDPSGMDQKTYNECLVQFEDASDCRKCLSSPLSVLNNRFIKIFSAPHNIVAPGEVDGIDEVYPGAKADEEEGLWAAVERGGPGGRGRGGRMGGRGRGRWNFGGRDFGGRGDYGGGRGDYGGGRGEFGGGRGDFGAEESSRRRADSSGQDQQQSVSGDSGELIVSVPNGERGSEKNSRGGGEEGNEDHPITPTAAQLEKERLRGMVQQKYDDLKSLRHRAEGIWRQKEDLLQGQIDQYRSMRNKLQLQLGSGSSNGEDKNKMMDTIEEKIMSLQSQLQEVRQQRETGNLPTSSQASSQGAHPGRGGRGGRGREFRGRGRALRGRGRGRFLANKSLDLRSKAIILTSPPPGLTQSAHQHFSRFGHVLKITPMDNDEGVIVHFASRRDAESAFNRGTNYHGQLMKIDWFEEAHVPVPHGGSGSGMGYEEDAEAAENSVDHDHGQQHREDEQDSTTMTPGEDQTS